MLFAVWPTLQSKILLTPMLGLHSGRAASHFSPFSYFAPILLPDFIISRLSANLQYYGNKSYW